MVLPCYRGIEIVCAMSLRSHDFSLVSDRRFVSLFLRSFGQTSGKSFKAILALYIGTSELLCIKGVVQSTEPLFNI